MSKHVIGEVLPRGVARLNLRRVLKESSEEGDLPSGGAAAMPRQRLILGLESYLSAGAEMHEGATVIDVKKNPLHRWRAKKQGDQDGKRGAVCGFSASSRNRMMKRMAECRRGTPAHFITLTTPCQSRPDEMKSMLWALWKRLERKWPDKKLSMIWKMEPHKKGDWHFHLIAYGFGYLPHRVLKSMWQDVIKSYGVPGAYHRGVHLKFIEGNDIQGIRNYMLKYMAKEISPADVQEWTGRMWGNRGELPRGQRQEIGLTVRENVWLWRLISRTRKRNVVKMAPAFYSNAPEIWVENARKVARVAALC